MIGTMPLGVLIMLAVYAVGIISVVLMIYRLRKKRPGMYLTAVGKRRIWALHLFVFFTSLAVAPAMTFTV